MRGKIVNLCIGFMNVLFGALILFFTIKVPQDKILLTVQENFVVNRILIAIYFVMGIIIIMDIIQSWQLRTDTTFNVAYLIGVCIISFIFIKQPVIAIFSILSGLIVLFKSVKENLVELNSNTAISISLVVMAACAIIAIVVFNYSNIGQSIKNKENKNELAYTSDYFKYVTELDITDAYINICRDGKYGYINQNGDVVIDFLYDYASPFVEITEYDKKFDIALVCKDGSSYIILKNGRKVLSYRTESSDDNIGAKIEELKNVYENTLKQTETMKFEIENITSNYTAVPVYKDYNSDYTFLYDYNEEFDLSVVQSNMGLPDKYELIKKSDPLIKITLDTTYLDYDTQYLYLFSNGTIPCYDISKRSQGWYTSYGIKNVMTGKAQILDYFEDKMIIKNYNNNTIYFIDSNKNTISDTYKDIYISKEDERYIVQDEDLYFRVIDKEFNSVFEKKYAVINTRLNSLGLYLVLDSTDDIKFNDYGYSKMNWKLLNHDGEVIVENIEQIYDLLYTKPQEKLVDEENYLLFVNNLKKLNYQFVGDKFYQEYK